MRKIIGVIFAFIGLVIVFSACKKTETYADKLKKEGKAIDRLIRDSGFVILDEYPVGRAFADKEYFKDPSTGIYIHVIDPGNGVMASKEYRTSVALRYSDVIRIGTSDDTRYSNKKQAGDLYYMDLTYGIPASYTCTSYSSSASRQYDMYMFLSPGCALPLEYVGDKAKVSLIVPFNNGSTLQKSSYEPLFYGNLEYRFID